MNVQVKAVLPKEEQERRRKLIAGAAWSARMEGLGQPLPERLALDELWITGQISRQERRERICAMLNERNARK